MKFSLSWLGDFIEAQPFFSEPQKLAQTLTEAGLEVDSFEDQRAKYGNIVVAELKSVKKHPQADRLTVCELGTGQQTHSVVCGAKNHKQGDKVLLALPGAILSEGMKIKKSKIRGVESAGMLASREELGFEKQEEGIWILPPSARVGTSLSEQLGLDDLIFEITIPPNRSDCLSHKGLAREIACLFSLSFRDNDYAIQEDPSLFVKKSIPVEVRDMEACPRYCGRLIKGVTIKESPDWLKKRLKSIGLKSINNVVDITNFILWDRGQPLHAFDRDKIQTVIVDRSQKDEKFFALDETVLTLTGKELTIRDKGRVLAMAGIIGGRDSCITEETKNIFIESACFVPQSLRKSSRRFGLETDSSYRFTRGVDILSVKTAMDEACYLIQKEAGGRVSKDFYDIYSPLKKTSSIKTHIKDLSDRLGYEASSQRFQHWMKSLGATVKTKNGYFEVSPPSYRQDLNIKEDLLEEFARLEGYHKIPETMPTVNSLSESFNLSNHKMLESKKVAGKDKDSISHFFNSQKLIQVLSDKGWCQAINYSFCDSSYYREFLKESFYLEELVSQTRQLDKQKKQSFLINNPLSQTLSLMKPLLTPDLVRNVIHNLRRNNKFGQIFELSPIFYRDIKELGKNYKQRSQAKTSTENYKQELHLALALWGIPMDMWASKKIPNFYIIKSVLKSLFKAFRVRGCLWERAEISFLHPGQSLILTMQKKIIGFLGSLHPQLLQKYKIPLDVAVAEIHWEFLDQIEKKPLRFKAFSNLLTVEKDLCFSIPLKISAGEVQKEIKKSLGILCEKVELFDIYESKGERFVSFRMSLSPKDKPWTDKELQALLNQVIEDVNKKFSVSLKSGD